MHDKAGMTATPLLERLGQTVRAMRGERGWSRRALAERTGISERFLADVEAGRGNPSVARLCLLADALGTTAAALLAAPAGGDPARTAIALLGLRGAGKSSVGAALAARLRCPFVELDERVEAASGLTLTEMFQLHGEAYYRRIEGDVLRDVLAQPRPQVIAAGGGVVGATETYAHLQARAHTVWLQATPQDHWTRVIAQGDTRPMADNEQAFADLCAILAEREKSYRQADVVVPTSARTVQQVTDELALHFAFLARSDEAGSSRSDDGP